ncbi:transcriptional regulator [Brevundimonas sp.]|uniref:transcriptional regulator n=1 Tax=Brevundimonas sp. TaxID=1871086 RepID=UPI002488BBAD|nr:transcriptional regulator [Brevundimonas sp.]MDI1281979.1 transcriptional regulator [Brevundimonas sp.]
MINSSYLLGLYGMTDWAASSGSASGVGTPVRKAQPTAPWSSSYNVPKPDELVRTAMAGRRIVDENAAQLDVSGASSDYRKLFALYQGLETLNALNNRAGTKGVGTTELALLAKRFSAGLEEVGTYVGATELNAVRLVQGTTSALSKSSGGVPRDNANSITGPIHEGSPDSVVAAFSGDVAFGITIRQLGVTTTVPIDLADMGSTPRTLTNVLEHINGKLEATGFNTRIGREQIKAEPRTINANGKTVTLPTGPDRWALVVRGDTTETLGFTAAQTSDAVYVVQGNGLTGGHQLLKFQSDGGTAPQVTEPGIGDTHWVEGRSVQTSLPPGIETVRASATGSDGSLWIVADVVPGTGNQPIKGERDVALMKYDSAGRLVASRALGAAATASGYAIAIDADGRVAVAGSVTGALDPGKSGDVATVADSFVTVFDANASELWTQRRGARAADEATSVGFGPNGTVYVAGRAQSAIPGGSAVGGWDGYVQAFSESQAYPSAPTVATAAGTAQFGTAADDGVEAITIDGSNLYSAGVEGGRMIVRQFALGAGGAPTLTATRDLGEASGEVAGLSVSGGRVILTGTTRNQALDVGTVNTAHSGGTDAFVAVLEPDLAASAADRLTYYGTVGDDTAADVKVQDGKVWVTGVSNRAEGAKDTDPTEGYLSRLDPLTGAVEWTRTWAGDGQQAAPMTLAVAAGGASVLDRLGLPTGEIQQSDSKKLTDATSLRAGDRFYVSPANGGRSVAVTIEARDTLQTLARKIEQASRNTLKVTVASEGAPASSTGDMQTALRTGVQRLSIMARDGKAGAVLTAGESGRNALAGLGLSQGFIGISSGTGAVRTFGLDLPRTLSLAPDAAKETGERLQAAMKAVRDAYRALAPASTKPKITGTAPAYLTAQIANYQAALSRLGG